MPLKTKDGKDLDAKFMTPEAQDAIEALFAPITTQITELNTALKGNTEAVATLAKLSERVEEIAKNIGTANPTDKDKDKNKPKDGDPADPTAALAALLKPITDQLATLTSERTASQKAAATKSAVEAFVGKKYENYAAKDALTEYLLDHGSRAEKLDDAVLQSLADKGTHFIARAAGKKNHAEYVGANPPKKTGGADSDKADEEEEDRKRIESIKSRGPALAPLPGGVATV